MAYYSTLKDYINDQIREPIKKALSNGEKYEVMFLVDFLISKYVESNNFAKAFENYAGEKGVSMTLPISDFIANYVAPLYEKNDKSWQKCELAYTEKFDKKFEKEYENYLKKREELE